MVIFLNQSAKLDSRNDIFSKGSNYSARLYFNFNKMNKYQNVCVCTFNCRHSPLMVEQSSTCNALTHFLHYCTTKNIKL